MKTEKTKTEKATTEKTQTEKTETEKAWFRAAVVPILLLAPLACQQRADAPATAADSGFVQLPIAAWRGYGSDSLPSGWQMVDSALTRVAAAGDIVTRDSFANFDLRLEWNISPGGNSGIMYRVIEGPEAAYMSGSEMQVLDDSGHANGSDRLTSAGSNFGLYPAPAGVVRPPGQWNAARVVANGAHVEHWLNGQKVVEYELWSPQWDSLVRASKFNAWPTYGRARAGRIALQDHGDRVAYRNIRIRALP